MKRRRISDKIDFTPEEQERRKKMALLGFPIFSLVLAALTSSPVLILLARGREISSFAYVPLALGILLFVNGIKRLLQNRQAIAEAFSKDKKDDDSI